MRKFLYAVTQHLLTRRNILFLNSLKGFQRSLAEISQYFYFVDNSNHLKDLVICILWTLVMSSSDAWVMIFTVILTVCEDIPLCCDSAFAHKKVLLFLAEISQYFHFVDNSNHLKDLVICLLWTLVMFLFDAQAMILTVILTVYQTQQL